MRSGFFLGSAAALALVCSGSAMAADTTIAGKIHIIKPGKLTKMVAPGSYTLPAPASSGDPVANGGSVNVFDIGDGNGLTSALPIAGWKGLGNPAGSKGYKYKGAGTLADPCKVVLVKSTIIKFVCKDDGALDPPLSGDSGIILSIGDQNFCAQFGGTTVKNDANLTKRKDAPAPGACPSPPVPCCNGDSFLSFSTVTAPGDCGDIRNQSGTLFANVACAGLYTGGGGNSVPLPLGVPDLGKAVTAITSCTGPAANIGATTSTQTGSIRNCTAPGCFFGAPLAVPNPGTPPTSVCVTNTVSSAPSGTVDCSTGATNISLPLSSILYLTGDTATDPMGTIAGVQPCPLCSAGTCIGGPNNGMSCTNGTTAINSAYPTSHDCPPDETFNIGTLPIAFGLSSGTITWEAVPGLGGSTQARVFSGYCRDADDTGAFESPAVHCLENGMTSGGDLAACDPMGVFEACEQRNQGAFGPAGGGNKTITAIGSAASILGGPAAATLVSIFSVPPTFNATVDAAGDLPGPGAVAIPGTAQSCAVANPCP
jgi:hypothetical protein